MGAYTYSVFTKPWKMPIPELGAFVHELGFDAIELPVRAGYPVPPEKVSEDLAPAVATLAEFGVSVCSVAGTADEPTIAACAEAGVPVLRVMASLGEGPYFDEVDAVRRKYDAVVPLLAQYGVTLGVQNHWGRFVAGAMGIHHLLEGYDPKHIAAIWDPAHDALCGEEPELALDILWPRLCMVNLKNPVYRRGDTTEDGDVPWHVDWTTGREGLVSWPRIARELKRRDWRGVLCLSSEYTDRGALKRNIRDDIVFAKQLFAD